MSALMTPLRDEHRGLLPEIAALRDTADQVGIVPSDVIAARIAARLVFLRDHLRPHAQAEDEVLYPAVARLMGSTHATDTMRRDHVEVVALTEQLAALHERVAAGTPLDQTTIDELRRVLYGLYAVVSLHFAKEEEVYVPILEAGLSADEAHDLFAAMHEAHHRLSAHHH